MTIKEKLIQFVCSVDQTNTLKTIGNLRCDRCKHWDAEKIRLDIMADFRDFAPCRRAIGQWAISETPADFFCALFEAK